MIKLTQDQAAIVDPEFEPFLRQFSWSTVWTRDRFYARTYMWISGERKTVQMHRFIMGMPKEMVDHINGDSLDNRLSNLRLATSQENTWNSKKVKGAINYIGVKQRKWGKYESDIRVDGKKVFLGSFDTAELAAQAYDVACLKHRGEFAALNFPLEGK